jgi:uncharacterized membrane protein
MWADVRGSFWFLPSVIIFCAMLLGMVLVELDTMVDGDALSRWPRIFVASPEGARNVLGTVAASMVTVAGVVFSMTLVVLSLASSQYSSRVLRNFMLDRINQSVLGIFLGIFVYCLVVLRTVRSVEEHQFTPSIAVLGGLVLGVLGIGVLIYYIHHISTSIQASQIAAVAYAETRRALGMLFPEDLGDEEPLEEPSETGRTWHVVRAVGTGYVRTVAGESLLGLVGSNDWIVRLRIAPGKFISDGFPVMEVLAGSPPTDEQRDALARTIVTGRQRTSEQDAGFGIRQLVDVALKALSPGVNDSTTAIMCIDYLTALMAHLAGRSIESDLRGKDGKLLVIAHGPTFKSLLDEAMNQVRESAEGKASVLLHLLHGIERIGERTRSTSRLKAVLTHLSAVTEAIERTIVAPIDRERLMEASASVTKQLGTQA